MPLSRTKDAELDDQNRALKADLRRLHDKITELQVQVRLAQEREDELDKENKALRAVDPQLQGKVEALEEELRGSNGRQESLDRERKTRDLADRLQTQTVTSEMQEAAEGLYNDLDKDGSDQSPEFRFSLAKILLQCNKFDLAEKVARRVFEERAKDRTDPNKDAAYRDSHRQLCSALIAQEKGDEEETEAMVLLRAAFAAERTCTDWMVETGERLTLLLKRPAEALAHQQRIWEKRTGDNSGQVSTLIYTGFLYAKAIQDDADQDAREGFELLSVEKQIKRIKVYEQLWRRFSHNFGGLSGADANRLLEAGYELGLYYSSRDWLWAEQVLFGVKGSFSEYYTGNKLATIDVLRALARIYDSNKPQTRDNEELVLRELFTMTKNDSPSGNGPPEAVIYGNNLARLLHEKADPKAQSIMREVFNMWKKRRSPGFLNAAYFYAELVYQTASATSDAESYREAASVYTVVWDIGRVDGGDDKLSPEDISSAVTKYAECLFRSQELSASLNQQNLLRIWDEVKAKDPVALGTIRFGQDIGQKLSKPSPNSDALLRPLQDIWRLFGHGDPWYGHALAIRLSQYGRHREAEAIFDKIRLHPPSLARLRQSRDCVYHYSHSLLKIGNLDRAAQFLGPTRAIAEPQSPQEVLLVRELEIATTAHSAHGLQSSLDEVKQAKSRLKVELKMYKEWHKQVTKSKLSVKVQDLVGTPEKLKDKAKG